MQYALLFYETDTSFTASDPTPEADAYWGAWKIYVEDMLASGIVRGGEGLLGPETATTLRIRDGRNQVQDGPFADTKEQLGGFFVIEVDDIDTALAWAAKGPCAPYGGVEIRPTLPQM